MRDTVGLSNGSENQDLWFWAPSLRGRTLLEQNLSCCIPLNHKLHDFRWEPQLLQAAVKLSFLVVLGWTPRIKWGCDTKFYCLSSTTESSAERGKTELCWPRSKYNTFQYSPAGWKMPSMVTTQGIPNNFIRAQQKTLFLNYNQQRQQDIYPSWSSIKIYREEQQRQKLQDDTKDWMKGRWTTSQTLPREIQVLSCTPSPTLLAENRSDF